MGSILDVAYLESPEPTVLIGSEHREVMSVALCLIVTMHLGGLPALYRLPVIFRALATKVSVINVWPVKPFETVPD